VTLQDSENINTALRAAISELEQVGRQRDVELTDEKTRLNQKRLETVVSEQQIQDMGKQLAQKDAQIAAAAARCVVCGGCARWGGG
jgi:vacuolar-type H+-ATPase subunit C/Vma6